MFVNRKEFEDFKERHYQDITKISRDLNLLLRELGYYVQEDPTEQYPQLRKIRRSDNG